MEYTMATKYEQKGTIKLSEKTKAQLREVGMMGETYEDVVKRLLFKKATGSDDDSATTERIKRLV